ncbi:MAG TPA: cytochrome b [Geminicoccaceae bacterium]|nr:cytochrome b [Geminicoccaceae bacterium]
MPSPPDRYDGVSIALHWLTVLMVLVQIGAGVTMEDVGRGPTQDLLYNLHKSLGILILLVVLLRLAWRWRHPWPPLPASMPRGQVVLARANHALLYATLLLMPVSGFVYTAAGGYPVPFLGLVELSGLVPRDEALSKAALAVHIVGKWTLLALLALHVAGALYHLLIRRDGVFQRMFPWAGGARGERAAGRV